MFEWRARAVLPTVLRTTEDSTGICNTAVTTVVCRQAMCENSDSQTMSSRTNTCTDTGTSIIVT